MYTRMDLSNEGKKSGWGFSARVSGREVQEQQRAYDMTTSSMRMEIEAITQALKCVTTIRQAHVIFVTDSQSTLRKIESGNLRAEWKEFLKKTTLKKITLIFTLGHAGVRGNQRADELAGKAKP